MAKVELKQPIVQEISENVKDAQSVVVVATPDMMGVVGRLGRVLGPKPILRALHRYLKDRAQSQSLRTMQQHLQES